MSLFQLLNGSNYGVYNRNIARSIGLNSTVLLSEILDKYSYFKSQESLIEIPGQEGLWFYLTGDVIEDRTSLTEKEQRPCIKKLESLGFIKTTKFGLPFKRHFQVCEEKISEFIISNNFSRTDKRPDWTLQKAKLEVTKGQTIYKNPIQEPKEEIEKESEADKPPPRSSAPPPIQKEIPREAEELASKLFNKIISIHPKAKVPKLEKWAREFDLMNRRDNKSWGDINEMLDWVFDDAFWYKQIQSPEALRKHWDKMAIQRASYSNKGTVAKRNREIAQEVKEYINSSRKENLLWIGNDFVRNTKTGDTISFDLASETFEMVLCKWFDIRKV